MRSMKRQKDMTPGDEPLRSEGIPYATGEEWISIPKMLAFNLAISCLTVSNSPLFTELTFHVSMQYRSLQHWILLSSPDTSRTESFSHFGCFILSVLNGGEAHPLFMDHSLVAKGIA